MYLQMLKQETQIKMKLKNSNQRNLQKKRMNLKSKSCPISQWTKKSQRLLRLKQRMKKVKTKYRRRQ